MNNGQGTEETTRNSQEAPTSEARSLDESLQILAVLLHELRGSCSRIYTDLRSLSKAQWELTRYVVTGSARIYLVRSLILACIGILILTTWVYGNVCVWRAVGSVTTIAAMPPFVLMLLNGGIAAFMYHWQKGIQLK